MVKGPGLWFAELLCVQQRQLSAVTEVFLQIGYQQDSMLVSGPSLGVCHMLHPATNHASMLHVERALSLQVQRRAVRDWDIVKSLFGLVWEPHTQLPALRMVPPHMHEDL